MRISTFVDISSRKLGKMLEAGERSTQGNLRIEKLPLVLHIFSTGKMIDQSQIGSGVDLTASMSSKSHTHFLQRTK